MKKVAPSRSPMTVYGRPDNASADDEAPARVVPPSAMSVPSLSVCLLTSLPPAFFLLSLFLPPLFLSAPRSLLSPSLSPSLSLALFLFSEEPPSPSVTMELCILQPFALLSPEWTHLLTLPLRIRVFPSMSFYHSSSILPPLPHIRTPDGQIDSSAQTHTSEQNCGQVLFMTETGNIGIVSE